MTLGLEGTTDPEATAKAVLAERAAGDEPPAPAKRERGRPKGSTKKKTDAKAPEEGPKPPTEAEIKAYAALGLLGWRAAAALFNLEELTEQESRELGEAIAPVAQKWIPALDKWAPEMGLAVCVAGLVLSKQKPKKKAGEAPPEDNER